MRIQTLSLGKIAFSWLVLGLVAIAPTMAQIDETPWHLEVEWELGSEESGVYFTSPRDLVIGTGNRIYLSDRREKYIQLLPGMDW